ncbi:hypothetical protein NEMIN01_0867 [Nematocida minor]|uniref:uncharacterized protein n=1 Tax=Nematocida minor TaxID=1912983 RepID=UPI00221FD6AE|nr:uncharacterized protein NEMIN01_0867 [Nematocida minor]KAI5190082.1 hypothetical protein NEMIN01_0867 [Nematocida minor]
MDEKKRYAWLDMYSTRNNTVTFEQLGVCEPFNEFFEGVLKINPSPEIKRFYKISLHLIGFLTIQKRIKKIIAKHQPLSPDEKRVLDLRAENIFWAATSNMPKAFIFSTLPELTVSKDFYRNLQEIAVEMAKLKKMQKPTHIADVQYRILERVLTNQEIRSRHSFARDKFTSNELQAVFKMFMRIKKNSMAESFYRHYELAYFLNVYYKERCLGNATPIAQCDIDFLVDRAGEGKDGISESDDTEGEGYERRIKDRKFVLIMHALINRFSKQVELSKKIEFYTVAILQTFLQKEALLGYFKDFSAEILIVGFTYIAMKVHSKDMSVRTVYEVYRSFGFITHFRVDDRNRLDITVEEIIKNLIVKTYNTLLPSILKNIKPKSQAPPSEASSPKEGSSSVKYMLSPLPGRMSQIVPVSENAKKVLFAEKQM